MAVTMKQVRAHLDPEEPDYPAAALLGANAIPHLMQLIEGSDSMLASKAAYLASLIQSDQSYFVLEKASASYQIAVRIAVASGIRNLKQAPISLVNRLLKDPNLGVRKVTLNSINAQPIKGIKGMKVQIEEIARKDPEVLIRNLAGQIAKRLK